MYELKPFILLVLGATGLNAEHLNSIGILSCLVLTACAGIIIYARLKHRGYIN